MSSRVQLALNVNDIGQAIAFYAKLFGTEPAKVRPGYANFAITDPPLKLVLFENPAASGTLNHLGVERASMDEVAEQADRLEAAGLSLETEGDVVCCYARQSKHWVTGPDGQRWENYVVLADAQPELEGRSAAGEAAPTGGCCGTGATATGAATTGAVAAIPSPGEPAAASACC